MSQITIVNLQPKYFAALEQLQLACYPTLGRQELMTTAHYRKQYEIFPAGQFVALEGETVVGQGSGFFTDFDFEHPNHSYREFCAGFYFTNHNPDGDYYYGADINVHPNYRRRGIGYLLYEARKELARRCNKKGIVAGGLIPGFARHKQTMTSRQYVEKVMTGQLHDATLSFQLRNGFRVRGLLQNYVQDSASDNWSTLIAWLNPDYKG